MEKLEEARAAESRTQEELIMERARAKRESQRAEQESARAEQESARAEKESARAEREFKRAELEKKRAREEKATLAQAREALRRERGISQRLRIKRDKTWRTMKKAFSRLYCFSRDIVNEMHPGAPLSEADLKRRMAERVAAEAEAEREARYVVDSPEYVGGEDDHTEDSQISLGIMDDVAVDDLENFIGNYMSDLHMPEIPLYSGTPPGFSHAAGPSSALGPDPPTGA
ncbi:unnamed protein product [Linum trigynum]|uniref:Uncharacterized protein n=1 Tax=Linum trigynum TaxID=586398 RepID=A0AAV2F9Y7_9ROSI